MKQVQKLTYRSVPSDVDSYDDHLLDLESMNYSCFTERDFHILVESISSNISDVQIRSIKFVRESLLTNENPALDNLINNQLIPVLVRCLQKNDKPVVQAEATLALTDIAGNTADQMQAVISAGAVSSFLNILNSSSQMVSERAVRALGLIIGHRPQLRNYVIDLNIVPKLLLFMNSAVPGTVMRDVTWIILNLCRNSHPPPVHVVDELLFVLNYLIRIEDIEIVSDVVWAVGYLTDKYDDDDYENAQIVQRVIENDIVNNLIPLLLHEYENVQLATLRVVSNIVSSTDEHARFVVNTGALNHFPALFNYSTDKMCQEAISCVSNFLARNQVQAVLDNGLIPEIIKQLTVSKVETQCEAAWAITQLSINGNLQQIQFLINAGVIAPYCSLLFSEDIQLIKTVLDGLHNLIMATSPNVYLVANLIEECDGFYKIEELKNHDKPAIYKIAYDIIERLSRQPFSV